MSTIYEKLKILGVEMDHHESDLYAEATPEAIELTKDEPNRTFFTSNIDGKRWIELPFAWEPFWEKAQRTVEYWAKGVTS